MPVRESAGNGVSHSSPPSYPGTSSAAATGSPDTPSVIVVPDLTRVCPSPEVRTRAEVNARSNVEAATVVVQGLAWSRVDAPGPELPADEFTVMPAAKASRNASSVASYGSPLPEME